MQRSARFRRVVNRSDHVGGCIYIESSFNMTIKLSAAIEADLVLKIAEGLQIHPIKHTYILFSDFRWAEELTEILPLDAREKIDRFIGERGLVRFISTEIDSEMYRTDPRPIIIAGQPPSQLPFVANAVSFARRLIAKLKSLPIRYRLTAALPGPFSHFLVDEIPDSISLPSQITISNGRALPSPMPVHSENASIDAELFHDWFASEQVDRAIQADRLYFSMPMLGYAVTSSSSVMGRQFEDHIRAFFGAAMALNVMAYGSSGETSKLPYLMVHNEETREIITTESLEDDLLERQYYFSSEAFAKRRSKDKCAAYIAAIKKIETIFNDDLDCRRLFSACIWFYRARVNLRPLDALLQATIAIEVMLGDRKAAEGIGLTNLLASRCAYLLGKSSAHRSEIGEKFRRVYELRSQIVHEGRHVLKAVDRATVQIANSLCAEIISRELSIRAMPDDSSF